MTKKEQIIKNKEQIINLYQDGLSSQEIVEKLSLGVTSQYLNRFLRGWGVISHKKEIPLDKLYEKKFVEGQTDKEIAKYFDRSVSTINEMIAYNLRCHHCKKPLNSKRRLCIDCIRQLLFEKPRDAVQRLANCDNKYLSNIESKSYYQKKEVDSRIKPKCLCPFCGEYGMRKKATRKTRKGLAYVCQCSLCNKYLIIY